MHLTIREVGEALLVEFPGASDDAANRAAVAAARQLSGRTGLLDAIPGARTIFLVLGAGLDRAALRKDLEAVDPGASMPGRTVSVPVRYGGEGALDLPELARRAGISPGEFARRHAAAVYRVAFLGFAPGFAYCVGLPEQLASPRLATPRTRVPAGSVAIGGPYTGVYPAETPGGWHLIGRSPARFFDPTADPPTLLLPGDTVAFEPIGDELRSPIFADPKRASAAGLDSSRALFRVHSPGLFTSLQGAPRWGRGAYGVPAGGAMDRVALATGNALVGNADGAAAFEVTLAGPELEVLADCRAAIAGATVTAEVNGVAAAAGRPFSLRRGDRLLLSRVTSGVRSYLCVAGGLAIASTQWQTQCLSKGEVVHGGYEARSVPLTAELSAPASTKGSVRVALGPQEDRFGGRAIAAFLSQTWRVSASSDRRGVRLEGQPLLQSGSAEIAPEGTALGAIQVPPDGQPIVLGPDRPVTGGYAKVATVLAADWQQVAQAAPGALLRFHLVLE